VKISSSIPSVSFFRADIKIAPPYEEKSKNKESDKQNSKIEVKKEEPPKDLNPDYSSYYSTEFLLDVLDDKGKVQIKLLANKLSEKDTPPIYTQSFEDANIPKGKFTKIEAEKLIITYSKEVIDTAKDENGFIDKKILREHLGMNLNLPPMVKASKS